MRGDWGFRAPLTEAGYLNCWLIGGGRARFASAHMNLAVLNLPAPAAAAAIKETPRRRHTHREAWAVYLTYEGSQTLQVGDERVVVAAGELLEIPPGVAHALRERSAPFWGLTIRAP